MKSLIVKSAISEPCPEDSGTEHGKLVTGLFKTTFSTTTITELDGDSRPVVIKARDIGRARRRVLGCSACDLREACSMPVPLSASLKSGVAILGEAPGELEDKLNVPFVGPSGKLIRSKLDNQGDSYSWLNVVCCRPPGNRTPTKAEVKACRGNLLAQLDALTPRYLLILGSTALSVVRPDLRVALHRGYVFTVQTRTIALATFHPAAVLRNKDLATLFDRDVAKFVDLVKGRAGLPELGCIICGKDAQTWDRDTIGYCWEHNRKYGDRWKSGLTGQTMGVWNAKRPRRKRGQSGEGMELDDRRSVGRAKDPT